MPFDAAAFRAARQATLPAELLQVLDAYDAHAASLPDPHPATCRFCVAATSALQNWAEAQDRQAAHVAWRNANPVAWSEWQAANVDLAREQE